MIKTLSIMLGHEIYFAIDGKSGRPPSTWPPSMSSREGIP